MTDSTSENKIDNPIPVSIKQKRHWGAKLFIFFIILILASLISIAIYGYQAFSKQTIKTMQQFSKIEMKLEEYNKKLQTMQDNLQTLQQNAQLSDSLREKQLQLVEDWENLQKSDGSIWRAKEAQHLVNLANDQMQFSPDLSQTILLLERAVELLMNVTDPALNTIKEAITNSINTLKLKPIVDIKSLYQQFVALNLQLDSLILVTQPLKDNTKTFSDTQHLPWWKAGLIYSWEALKQIVIIRKQNVAETPLVFPEEKPFLYQNMHAQMEGILWAILHKQQELYVSNIERLMRWIQLYCDANHPQTRNILARLVALKQMQLQTTDLSLQPILQNFDQYFNLNLNQSAPQ